MEEKTIAPIQTYYNGYHFRSRLEARWAVFFDAAGIEYEYEPEGFVLNRDALRDDEYWNYRINIAEAKYLPDFYLPEYDYYVEVKPNRDNVEQDLDRAVSVMCSNKKNLLILRDIPYDPNHGIFWFPIFYFHPVKREIRGQSVTFLQAGYEDRDALYILTNFTMCNLLPRYLNMADRYEIYNDKDTQGEKCVIDGEEHTFYIYEHFYSTLQQKCFRAARQARFEHGETPWGLRKH